MPTSTDEREWFHNTIENITDDKTKYNYWVPEISHSPLLVSRPYYEPSLSIEYLPFFLTSLSQPVRNKNREKIHAKEKQSHAQDSIYVVRQFAYVHGVAGISLLLGKNTEYHISDYNIFSLYIHNNHTTLKNPNYKRWFHNGLNGPNRP